VDDLLTERLAELAVGFGANVQADQIVMVTAELGRESLARAVAAAAYRAGARYVDVTYTDAFVRRAKIENAGDEAIGYAPAWHVERMKQMTPAKIAPLAVALAADSGADVTGQVFAVRNNEIFLMSQPRPIRSVHRGEGWTPETVAQHALPALKGSFYALDRSSDVFTWEPV